VIFGRPPIFDMNCDWSITDRLENILSFVKKKITPLESPGIPAYRQTDMLRMVEIPAKAGASAPYSCLRAGREGRVKALPFLTG